MIATLAMAVLLAQAAPPSPPPAPAPAPLGKPRITSEGSAELGVRFVALPRRDAVQLQPWASIRFTDRVSDHFRWHADVLAEGLIADRGGSVNDARADVREAWFETSAGALDVRAGFGRIPWGRLDEVQPTDLINPLDTSRLLLFGRAEARRAVGFVRARVTASESLRVEGILVPFFRRGVFDALDEASSPFNLTRDAVLPAIAIADDGHVRHDTPEAAWRNMSGGGRVDATIGRVDLGVSAYRGFDAFGPVILETTVTPPVPPQIVPAVVGQLVQFHPRFTMAGADFETVTGEWAWRGEAAVVTERTFAGVTRGELVRGRAVDAGAGFDRRAGEFRVYGSVLIHHDWSDADPAIAQTNTSLVGSIDRRFDRDRWLVRAFAVVNPADRSGFVRGLAAWAPRDHVSFDFSAGAFVGTGDDTISRFKGRDFVLIAVTVK